MPFDTCTFQEAHKWAKERYEKLEKCPSCGEIMEEATEWYQAGTWTSQGFFPYDDGFKYCSEYCAEKASEFEPEEEEV